MGNGGYPRTDLNVRQNSKNKIQIFLNFTFLNFVLGSNLSQVAPFPTTDSGFNFDLTKQSFKDLALQNVTRGGDGNTLETLLGFKI